MSFHICYNPYLSWPFWHFDQEEGFQILFYTYKNDNVKTKYKTVDS